MFSQVKPSAPSDATVHGIQLPDIINESNFPDYYKLTLHSWERSNRKDTSRFLSIALGDLPTAETVISCISIDYCIGYPQRKDLR